MALLGVDLLNKTAFETLLGRSVDHVRIFAQTQTPPGSQWTPVTTYINAGYSVMVSWKAVGSWASVASGAEDARIDAIGAFLHSQSNTPARQNYYTFHHEPENDGVAADYRAAMARVLSRIGAITPTSRWVGGVCYKSSSMAGMPNHTGEDPEEWFVAAPMMFVDLYNYMGTSTGPWATPEAGSPGSQTYLNTHPRDIEDLQAWMDFGASHGVTRFGIPEFGSALHNVPPINFTQRTTWMQQFSNRYQGVPNLEFVDYYNQGITTGFTEQRLTSNANYGDDTAAMAAFADLEAPVVGNGWGDGAWGDLYWGGQRANATYLGNTTLSGGTTTWTTETVFPLGSKLTFAPSASSTTLVMDNKNLIIYGELEMHQPDPTKTMTIRFTNVDEQEFVGASAPQSGPPPTYLPIPRNVGTMRPSTTDVGLWCMDTAPFDVIGATKVGWNRTRSDPTWQTGDEIKTAPWAIGDYTSYDHFYRNGVLGHYSNFVPATDTLQTVAPGNGVTYTQECFNLTRNIRFEGTAGHRSHVMIMTPGITQTIKYCSFQHMGPRKLTGVGSETIEIRGRWAGIHLHHQMSGGYGTVIEGVVARDGGSHTYVAHDSFGVVFRDCISYHTQEDPYWWDNELIRIAPGEGNSSFTTAPDQLSGDVLYDRCLAAWLWYAPGEPGAGLTGFQLLAFDGNEVKDCTVFGNLGLSTSSGYRWPEGNGAIWANSNNVAHNNAGRGVYIWQNLQSDNPVPGMVCFRNGIGGITNGAYINNYHFSDCVSFQNLGSGDRADFMAAARGSTHVPPTWAQVIQDCWFEDMLVMHHVGSGTAGDPAIVRNNHLGHVFIDEFRSSGQFLHGEWDFIENDCDEPEDFCNLTHPHTGNHIATYLFNGNQYDPSQGIYRVQRANGTAFRITQVGTSTTQWTAVTIPAFAFAVPAQTPTQAIQNNPYSYTLTYNGTENHPSHPVTWQLNADSGALPNGLTLNPTTGNIVGTPTASGSFPLIVEAVDASTQIARRTVTLGVTAAGAAKTVTVGLINQSPTVFAPTSITRASSRIVTAGLIDQSAVVFTPSSVTRGTVPPIVITTGSLDVGEVGVVYSETLTATGGSPSPTWSIDSGTLPDGLALDPATGIISGLPTTADTASLVLRVTDNGARTDTATLDLTVADAMSMPFQPMPRAHVGNFYTFAYTVEGGIPPYFFAPGDDAALPDGLLLSVDGVLSGTPTNPSSFQFTLFVNDSIGGLLEAQAHLEVAIGLHRVGRSLAMRGSSGYVSV